MQTKKNSYDLPMQNNSAGRILLHRERQTTWLFKLHTDNPYDPMRYRQINRRDYYKIVLVTEGSAVLAIGADQYNVQAPSVLFIHPHDLISWTLQDDQPIPFSAMAIYIKQEAMQKPPLKSLIEQFQVFDNTAQKIGRLSCQGDLIVLSGYFRKMQDIIDRNEYTVDYLVGYLQLLIVETKQRCFITPFNRSNNTPKHVREFFELLEKEVAAIGSSSSRNLKTAREFAQQLAVHPNYLNALIKKHTGENISTHIRNRFIEESKSLLIQTDWSIKEISYSVGFSDPPNFSLFFKKNTGQTPAEFRSKATRA